MEGHWASQKPCIVVHKEDTLEAHYGYYMMYEKTHLASVKEVIRIIHFVQLNEGVNNVVHDAYK